MAAADNILFLRKIAKDERLTICHFAILMALLSIGGRLNVTFHISRRQVMQFAHISSITTYHKCINDLKLYAYIVYHPSFHPGKRTEVRLSF
jgi:hypothetical protein